MHSAQCKVHIQCTVYSIQFTVYTVHYNHCTVSSVVYSVRHHVNSTVHSSAQCVSVQCTVQKLHNEFVSTDGLATLGMAENIISLFPVGSDDKSSLFFRIRR